MAEPIDIKDRTPNLETIKMLEKLLQRAKDGELRTLVTICMWDNDGCTHGWSLDKRNSRRRMLGELAFVNYELLTNLAIEDGDTILAKALDN